MTPMLIEHCPSHLN
jgi:hypothetical protein